MIEKPYSCTKTEATMMEKTIDDEHVNINHIVPNQPKIREAV